MNPSISSSQGDKVRALKAAKAPKDQVTAEVAVLLALKKELAAAQQGERECFKIRG